MRVTFGIPEPHGAVAAGNDTLVYTFTSQGLQEAHAKAKHELHGLSYPGCLPESALGMLPEGAIGSLRLSWDGPRQRELHSQITVTR